jgi:DNA invertase Pin-like site-specific DNA recombinase
MIVDGYVRVSVVGGRLAKGDRFISPALQREQIEAWAKLNGALVGRIFEELDESGGRSDRPRFLRVVERVEQRESDGVVVAKLDRFARSLLDALLAIERIQRAGGTFVAVQDGLDLRTDTGRFVLRVMLSMAELELDRIRTTWSSARERAVARGLYVAPAPTGYSKRDGRLVADPATAPFIAEAFRRRARRESDRQIGLFLEANGVRTRCGNVGWANATVRALFPRRAYLGESRSGVFVNERAHEPIVDVATWHAAQGPDQLEDPRVGASPALLRGLLRCATCRRRLRSAIRQFGDGRRHRYYYCQGNTAGGACPARATISASVVEPYVEAVFWQELERRRKRVNRKQLEVLVAAAERAEAALLTYRDNPRIIEALGAERFAEGLRRRRRSVERARLAVAAERARLDRAQPSALRDLHARWQSLTVTERRAAIAEVIECGFVNAGRNQPAERRVAVCLRGEAPLDLPAPGKSSELRPFDAAECRGRSPVQLCQPRRLWAERKVRRQLDGFVSDRRFFPSCEQFQIAGLLALYEQVKLHGGERRWARELGISHLPYEHRAGGWSEQRIRDELQGFLDGRRYWPTVAEFKAAGLGQARLALNRHGGAERWALDFGLACQPGAFGARLQWTAERMDEAIATVLRGRIVWPSEREFREARLCGLYSAMQRCGGTRYWARRVGFTEDTTPRIMRRPKPYRRPATLPVDPRPWVRHQKRRTIAVWDEQAIVDAIWRWADEHGRAPRASDWSPHAARSVRDYYAAPYPATTNVVRTFGSWSAALRTAGIDCGTSRGSLLIKVRDDASVPRLPPRLPANRG